MTQSIQFNLLATAAATLLLVGCGDAKTTLVEKDPIEVPSDANEDDHDHSDDGYTIESMGRLAVLSGESDDISLFDLDDGSALDTFSLIHESNTLEVSGDYRYAVIVNREQDYFGFIDGGLWREEHTDHLHDYQQAPVISNYEIVGSRPTHILKHDGQMAIFFDGDAQTNIPASVQVLTDTDIAHESSVLPTIEYTVNMHGVAEPRGEHLLATIRRDDSENTSYNKILPDQVGVYHLHNDEYELEQVLDLTCPDLHGVAQNDDYVVFGCSDGVLVAHQHNDEYDVEKIVNADTLDGVRISTLYGHEDAESFIGVAAQHDGSNPILMHVNPIESEMEALEWQPEARPVAYGFAHEGEHFLVLDEQGYLNILTAHEHDGHTHWELDTQMNIATQDVSTMPEGLSFSMTVAQNDHYVYVSDPIAQHILQIHLEDQEIEGDIELDFIPAAITWLGIAQEHDHD